MTPAPEPLMLANGKNYKPSEKLEGKVAFITVRPSASLLPFHLLQL
jgi:hypothetical protein